MSFACGHLGKSESDGHRGNTQGPQDDVAQDLDISISLCDLQLCRETFALPILGRFETSAFPVILSKEQNVRCPRARGYVYLRNAGVTNMLT